MTRYFEYEFMEVASFLNIQDATPIIGDAIDGKVITLYSFTNIVPDDIKKHFSKLGCDRLVVVAPKKNLTTRKQLANFDILQSLKEKNAFNGDDEVLKRELPILEDDITQEVTNELDGIYGEESDACVLSIQKGKVVVGKAGSEEQAVNACCFDLYQKSPLINNEIINRNAVSSAQTKKARLNIITALLTNTDDEEFYAGTNQEATVYRSLFIRTGLKGQQVAPDRYLLEVINAINGFIDSCSDNKTSISGLIHKLTSAPYGMRKGVLPIYLAYKTSSGRSLKWSDDIIDKFHPSVNTLFSFELPDSDSMTGYIPFLEDDFNGNNEEFKEAFRWSNAYCWLVDDVRQHGGEAYFGELTADLHDVLVSDPKPYRKDVKKMLANLLSIVEKLNMPELLIDRPNYSQRVRIVR